MELLAVIAIIGILAAIIIPVVGKVRESARASHCSASMRSIGQAVLLFCGENRNRLPMANAAFTATDPLDPSTRFGHWYVQIAPYLSVDLDGANSSNARAQVKVGHLVGCPDAPMYEISVDLQGIGTSYGWNNVPYSSNAPQLANGIDIRSIPLPSRTIMVGERFGKNSGGSRDTNWSVSPPWVVAPIDPDNPPAGVNPAALRISHNGRSNYIFFDGHVAMLLPDETYSGTGPNPTGASMWRGL